MTNLTEDRKKFHRQIIHFHADCPHKRIEIRFDTMSMEYGDYCRDCKQFVA